MDTQLPRYEVFLQERRDKPFRAVGTVHSADSEMALLNARTVFVRRPNCTGLWVVPDSKILRVTAEELAAGWQGDDEEEGDRNSAGTLQPFYLFQKLHHRRSMTFVEHVGEINATDATNALQTALQKSSQEDIFVWWVCPKSAILASDPNDVDSWFAPAKEKIYKQQSHYSSVG